MIWGISREEKGRITAKELKISHYLQVSARQQGVYANVIYVCPNRKIPKSCRNKSFHISGSSSFFLYKFLFSFFTTQTTLCSSFDQQFYYDYYDTKKFFIFYSKKAILEYFLQYLNEQLGL